MVPIEAEDSIIVEAIGRRAAAIALRRRQTTIDHRRTTFLERLVDRLRVPALAIDRTATAVADGSEDRYAFSFSRMSHFGNDPKIAFVFKETLKHFRPSKRTVATRRRWKSSRFGRVQAAIRCVALLSSINVGRSVEAFYWRHDDER